MPAVTSEIAFDLSHLTKFTSKSLCIEQVGVAPAFRLFIFDFIVCQTSRTTRICDYISPIIFSMLLFKFSSLDYIIYFMGDFLWFVRFLRPTLQQSHFFSIYLLVQYNV